MLSLRKDSSVSRDTIYLHVLELEKHLLREDPTTQYQIIEEGAINIKKETKIHSRNLTVQLRRLWYLEFGKVY